jgi:DNA-binding transcriptional regulator GbsR (MarR family)
MAFLESHEDMAVDLVAFIRRAIPSLWTLETLLLMRASAARPWTSPELVEALRASEPVVSGALAHLERCGVVQRADGDRYTFAPDEDSVAALCDALAEAWRDRPVAVTRFVTSPDERIQELSEAFRFTPRKRP